jgi:ribosomal protein L34
MSKFTLNGSRLKAIKVSGFRARMKTKQGRTVLKNRRKKVDESIDPDFARKNKNLVQDFEMAKMHKFYEALRKSSVVNMWGAAPYFWMGKDRLAHHHFYEEMDDDKAESFEKVLDSADEIKNILINGTIKTLEREGKEVTLDSVKRVAERKARQIVVFIQQVY